MRKKYKEQKLKVYFEGNASEDVTGSMYFVDGENSKILLECGLSQTNNILADYRANTQKPKNFKIKELDYIFVMHNHADHSLRLPYLYKHGCKAKIIVPKGFISLFEIMAKDSAFIMEKDSEYLTKRHKKYFEPIYTEEDVYNCIQYMIEIDSTNKVELDKNISFRFTPAGHIINSMQLELWVKHCNKIKKIAYTSDLGNMSLPKYYSGKFNKMYNADLLIGECTYCNQKKRVSMRNRNTDLQKMKTIVLETMAKNGRVLITVFALNRTQNIITFLYELLYNEKDFTQKILIDSPLATKISKLFQEELLSDDDLEKWNKVCEWENLHFIEEYNESKFYRNSSEPLVVLACSGMLVGNGRSIQWLKEILGKRNSHIIFVGYTAENSLARKIQNEKATRNFTIDGCVRKNLANITDLKSFSSHMQKIDLLNYYGDFNADKIALVHGNKKDKLKFAEELKEKRSENNRTGKVIVVQKGFYVSI